MLQHRIEKSHYKRQDSREFAEFLDRFSFHETCRSTRMAANMLEVLWKSA